MDVEENEISKIVDFSNDLYANLAILEQTKLNLFIKRSTNLKNINANFLSSDKRMRFVKKTEKKESKRLGKTRTRMFMVGCFNWLHSRPGMD